MSRICENIFFVYFRLGITLIYSMSLTEHFSIKLSAPQNKRNYWCLHMPRLFFCFFFFSRFPHPILVFSLFFLKVFKRYMKIFRNCCFYLFIYLFVYWSRCFLRPYPCCLKDEALALFHELYFRRWVICLSPNCLKVYRKY